MAQRYSAKEVEAMMASGALEPEQASTPEPAAKPRRFTAEEITALAQSGNLEPVPEEPNMLGRLARKTTDMLPFVGGVAGATLGGVPGAAAGAFAGAGIKNLADYYVWPDRRRDIEESGKYSGDTAVERLAKILAEPTYEAAMEVAGAKVADKIVSPALKFIARQTDEIRDAFRAAPKSEELLAAASRTGVPLTPGMRAGNPQGFTASLESSLSKSPSLGGALVRQDIDKAFSAINDSADLITSQRTVLNPTEVGAKLIASVADDARASYEPARLLYEELTPIFLKTKVDEDAANSVLNALSKRQIFRTTAGKQLLSEIKEDFPKRFKNLQDLSDEITDLGQEISRSTGREQRRLIETRDALKTIRDMSIEAMDQRTKQAAQAQTRKIADGLFKQSLDDINEYASLYGRPQGFKSAKEFFEYIGDVDPGNFAKKFLNPARASKLAAFKQKFPSEFEEIKQLKIDDLVRKSSIMGEFNVRKFVKNLDEFQKKNSEIFDLLFNSTEQLRLDDLKTIINSIPANINPSNTAAAATWMQLLNPIVHGSEMARYGLYRAQELPRTVRNAVPDTIGALGDLLKARPTQYMVGIGATPTYNDVFGTPEERLMYTDQVKNDPKLSPIEKARARTRANRFNTRSPVTSQTSPGL